MSLIGLIYYMFTTKSMVGSCCACDSYVTVIGHKTIGKTGSATGEYADNVLAALSQQKRTGYQSGALQRDYSGCFGSLNFIHSRTKFSKSENKVLSKLYETRCKIYLKQFILYIIAKKKSSYKFHNNQISYRAISRQPCNYAD